MKDENQEIQNLIPITNNPIIGNLNNHAKSNEYSSLLVGKFNHARWSFITDIYSNLLQNQEVQNTLGLAGLSFVGNVHEANMDTEFLDLPINSWQSRAYDMGIRRAYRNINYLAGSNLYKIINTIKAFEGFEDSKGNKAIQSPDEIYLYAQHHKDEINNAGLYHILTGEYSRVEGSREKTPEFIEFEASLENALLDNEKMIKIYELYQMGIRMEILHTIAKL
jgi:hypothetical protein